MLRFKLADGLGWVAFLLCAGSLIAQEKKPILPETDGSAWLRPKYVGLDFTGQHVVYDITDQSGKHSAAVLQSIDSNRMSEWPDAHAVGILNRSAVAVMEGPGDQLTLVSLATKSVVQIPQATSARIAEAGSRQWLAYYSRGAEVALVVRDDAGKELRFPGATAYSFGDVASSLVLHVDGPFERGRKRSLVWVDLQSGQQLVLWSQNYLPGVKVVEPCEIWDGENDAVAFAVEDLREGVAKSAIWYFKAGMAAPECLVTSANLGLGNDVILPEPASSSLMFVANGGVLTFQVEVKSSPPRAKLEMASLDVWSYKDPTIQSHQLRLERSAGSRTFLTAAMRISDRRIKRLTQTPLEYVRPEHITDSRFMILRRLGGSYAEEGNWNHAAQVDILVRSFDDENELVVAHGLPEPADSYYSLSPSGRYLIYWNAFERNWFARNLPSGEERNLTGNCPVAWLQRDLPEGGGGQDYPPVPLPAWLGNSDSFLLCSYSDIWKFSLNSSIDPENLTENCSSRAHVIYRVPRFYVRSPARERWLTKKLLSQSAILVHALDWDTKDEGFLKLSINHPANNEVSFQSAQTELLSWSEEGNGYIVSMKNAVVAPNLYYTKDFKAYTKVSDIHPEKDYRWPTAELMTWTGLSGKPAQGVLFKPDDFNPQRKYPVIFSYYQYESDEMLKTFRYPGLAQVNGAELYAPLYVGRGYLVFYVDILPGNAGQVGKSALDAVTSAAQMLSERAWVDSRHMAIFGHSFGGFETDFIVSHTERFAAAISGSGWPDFVSAYNGLRSLPNGETYQSYAENGHAQFRSTLWERPLDYIDNSPVFAADRVTTPMLLMTNIGDPDINFFWGAEWFNALRRLGKKAWMLQYDGEGHNLGSRLAQLDFDIRVHQFLDHYLKAAPAPKWMTQGIRAKDKGYETGFELDASDQEP